MSYEPLQSASSFTSEQCLEGIVAISGNTLRILALERLDQIFNQQHIPLDYTPRRLTHHEPSGKLLMIETDHNAYDPKKVATQFKPPVVDSMQTDDDDEEDAPIPVKTVPVPAAVPSWGSQLRVFDPIQGTSSTVLPFEPNEAAVSLTTCVFHDRGGEVFILVGTVKKQQLHKASTFEEANIHVYRLIDGDKLVLVHSTVLDGIPYVMCPFQGRVLVSVGKVLRIYDLGKRKLLRKCENKQIPTVITQIQVSGTRIYVGDLHESFHFLKYKRQENQLIIFADDAIPRHLSAQVVLDYDTIAGGDKFGNVFVCRLPSEVSDECIENPAGNRMLWDTGIMNGAPNKLEQIVQFHLGQVVTSLKRTTLIPGGTQVLLYSTVLGTIGACIPLTTQEDIEFYSHLETLLRQEYPSPTGRDHLSYRSYFIPVKSATDGDLCEQFLQLSLEKQQKLAKEMDRTPIEISKKLEDLRNHLI